MTPSPPLTLETARLLLRWFVHDDWLALHEHYSDPECTRFTFERALTEGESWRAMAAMVGHWHIRGYGPYVAVEKETRQVVGTVGLWFPNDWPEPEIKWALLRRFWGVGYATEAVRRIQPVALSCLGHPPISFINELNVASRKLAVRVGCCLEKNVSFRAGTWCQYRHPTVVQS